MPKNKKAKVIIAVGNDRRVMVRQAINELGNEFQSRAKSAKRIFIHPNLVSDKKQSATTHVEAVRGVVDHIALLRKDKILIGDASYHNTKKSFESFDYPSLSRSGNIKLIDLNEDETLPSFAYTSEMKKREIGFSKTVADSDFIIAVVPAKMHHYYIVSLSLKTHIVGSMIVPQSPFGIHARWPWLHTGFKPAHKTLAEVYMEHPADLAIIDGTMAMEGNGPSDGNTVNLGWVIASFHPVCADALAVYLMGIEPSKIGYLYYLDKKGFGPINPQEMEIIGHNREKIKQKLLLPDSAPKIFDWG